MEVSEGDIRVNAKSFFRSKVGYGGGVPGKYQRKKQNFLQVRLDSLGPERDLGFRIANQPVPFSSFWQRAFDVMIDEEEIIMNVLVVDDSGVMRKIIARSLGALGINDIQEAGDGREALKVFGDGSSFDLVITDWNMPEMNGLELTKEIRSGGSKVPVMMVTTESEKESVLQAIQAGVNDYLVKPFDNEMLKLKLNRLVKV